MGWIIIINMNFKIVGERAPSQSVTLRAAPPPSHLQEQKEQEGAGR